MVSLVLLLTCVNLANILLARGEARRRETAVRLAIGGGRWRVVRGVFAESAILAVAGAALGLCLAPLLRTILRTLRIGGAFLAEIDLSANPRMIVITLGLTIATACLFGSVPAWMASRVPLLGSLQAGSRSSASQGRGSFGRTLVVVQMALCVVLLIASGLLSRSLWKLLHADLGFSLDDRISFELDAGSAGSDASRLGARIVEEVQRIPGVRSAAVSIAQLLGGGGNYSAIFASGHVPAPGDTNNTQENIVTPGYFRTMGLPLLHGRECEDRDTRSAPHVVVVSETFARHFFGTADALGRRIGYSRSRANEFEIVGVMRDSSINGPREPMPRWVVHCLAQHGGHFVQPRVLEISFRGDAASVTAGVRQALRDVDRNLLVRSVSTMRQLYDSKLSQERALAAASGFFGALAVLLAAVGVYGLLAYSVVRQRSEIGIRMALGAQPIDVRRWVLARAWFLGGLGVLFGLPAGYLAARAMSTLLFGLEPYDPPTYLATAAGLLAVATAGALLPALRASRLAPAIVLRAD